MSPSLEVVEPGPLTLVQDLGRPGQAAIGVSPSGAFDRTAHALAQRLVGNPADAAGLEVLLGGLTVRAQGTVTIAVTGAPAPLVRHHHDHDRRWDPYTVVTLTDGDLLRLGPPRTGLRSYLAVRGGLDLTPTLGSRSTDRLSGLGPAPLSPADRLTIGPDPHDPASTADTVPWPEPPGPVRVWPGPRRDWFTADAWAALTTTAWTVTADSDRVGVRLDGPPLERIPARRRAELPSEPGLRGAIQLPPSGLPLVFGPDHPVTGGYPVIAVVDPAGCDTLAQLRPGETVRFVP